MTAPGAGSDDAVAPSRSTGAARPGASALWRDMAGGAAADPGFAWALVVGVALVAIGLLGFVPNPLVGSPTAGWGTPVLLTGDAHDVIHLVGGAIAIHAALGLSRPHRDAVLVGLGTAALVLLALGLLDGRWFGVAPYPVGLGDQLLHLVVGLGSLVMGLAGSGVVNVPVVTGAYRRASVASASGTGTAAPVTGHAVEADTHVRHDASPGEDAQPAEAMPEMLGLEFERPEPEASGEATEPEAIGEGTEPEASGERTDQEATEPEATGAKGTGGAEPAGAEVAGGAEPAGAASTEAEVAGGAEPVGAASGPPAQADAEPEGGDAPTAETPEDGSA